MESDTAIDGENLSDQGLYMYANLRGRIILAFSTMVFQFRHIIRRGGSGLGGPPAGLGRNRSAVLYINIVRLTPFRYESSTESSYDEPLAFRTEIIVIVRGISNCTVAISFNIRLKPVSRRFPPLLLV